MDTFCRFRLSHWKHVFARTKANIYNNYCNGRPNISKHHYYKYQPVLTSKKTPSDLKSTKKIYEYLIYLLILLLVRSYEFFSRNLFSTVFNRSRRFFVHFSFDWIRFPSFSSFSCNSIANEHPLTEMRRDSIDSCKYYFSFCHKHDLRR